MTKIGSFGVLIILTVIYVPYEASLISLFTGGSDKDIPVPKLILAPANATISPNVSVTLGCKSNVPASQCQWAFYSTVEPEKRKNLTPFSPSSPNERKKQFGGRAENDCSLTIHKIAAKYDGKWICSILPVSGDQKFLISKPAFLHIYERPETPKSQGEIFADESDEIGREEEETTQNPRDPVKLPYFVIKRKPDNSLDVTWNLEHIQRDVDHCSWISPDRVRISSQNSLSDLVWTSQSNHSCGIQIQSQETSSNAGEWTVVAESEDDKPIISSQFYISPAPKHESSTVISTTAQYYTDAMDPSVSTNSDKKRHSVIGIDSEITKEPSGPQPVTYSHIIPKYERNNNHEYLTIQVPNLGSLKKRPNPEDTQYEQVNKPLPSYENQTEFATFGFASLRRPSKPRVAIRKVSSMSVTSAQSQGGASDSGVDSDQMDK
ncbi:hypothetical protein TCAL_06543 [Tigriopus californicus]|uniref:Ig-like domain-containing protein n=1 Tax=Tigriopus californicus TaxID=6832 RepID=A0A553P0M4_TIGCA|nr:hypothetical protein TCAL_06543 [Tigriopus californicus]|eukprot:TCALIF_06543-PA protein Name:"Protein of unknown function" AED:0.29 eAED:0.14 QI:149/0.66/0.25/0.75/0.33/0.75/4/0/434